MGSFFPAAVMDEASRLPLSPTEEQIEEALLHGRKDLRNLQTITIDGEEARYVHGFRKRPEVLMRKVLGIVLLKEFEKNICFFEISC